MEKKNVKEIIAQSAVKAITNRKAVFDKLISINGCNGSSDLGQLTSAVSNLVRDKVPNAFVGCPYALFPEVEGPSQVLLHSDHHIILDGCKDRCLAKTMEKAGFKVDLSYAMDEDFGLVKHPQPEKFKEEDLIRVADKIIEDIKKLDLYENPKMNEYQKTES